MARRAESSAPEYCLEDQIGFILRQAYQRHVVLFADAFGNSFTPMQWAAVAKLAAAGPCSQNLLGRLTAMDVATIKGVINRLTKRGYAEVMHDKIDRRRYSVSLTPAGQEAYERWVGAAKEISRKTLADLQPADRRRLLTLLKRLR